MIARRLLPVLCRATTPRAALSPSRPKNRPETPGPSPTWSSGCWPCLMKTHRGHGKKPCATSMHTPPPQALRGSLLIMARLILMDSGPLGLIVRAPSKPQVVRCLTWLKAISAAGATVIIPEIAHYEVRRELIRIRAVGSLRRLEHYLDPSSGLRHLTLTTDAMIRAAEFWAFLRQMGIPTASPDCARRRCDPGRTSGPRWSAGGHRDHRDDEPGAFEPFPRNRRPYLGSDPVGSGTAGRLRGL